MSHILISNAKVEVTHVIDDKKHNVAMITVNDKYQHRFSPKSRVSHHLDIMTKDDLQERLNGGKFFFVEDQLVDFRDNSYNGFVHDEKTISTFIDLLGYQRKQDQTLHNPRRLARQFDNETGSEIALRKVWSNNEISVPGYQQGGDFNSQLSFVWNPFTKTINSAFELVRLICTNGMVGLTSFLNTKIPLVNRWQEHLDIASTQIQNKVNSIVVERIQAMATERASVGDCLLLEQHCFDRLASPFAREQDEKNRLRSLIAAVSPKVHLADVYRDNVFADKQLAAQLPSHLSNFDTFNIATELRTHTNESAKSSATGLDKFANGILFDRQDNFSASAMRFSQAKNSSFADVNRAFYG